MDFAITITITITITIAIIVMDFAITITITIAIPNCPMSLLSDVQKLIELSPDRGFANELSRLEQAQKVYQEKQKDEMICMCRGNIGA